MKIAFLNFYSGFIARGGETFVHELANRLAKKNETCVFQAGPASGREKYSIVRIDISMPKIWPEWSPIRYPRFFLDYYKLKELHFTIKSLTRIIRLRPNVIFPLNGGWQALICSLYCRFFGAKLVIVGQSGPGWDDRWNLLMKPNLFVALTNRQLAWAKRATIWKQDFALVPNGVDLDQFKPAVKKIKLDLEKPIIMMAAASTPDKRVEQGIRAVAGLPTGSLLLLGQGPLDESINKLGYKLLGKTRFLHLSVSHDQMPDYYRNADLFSLCSISSEAFGIVYLEAMATNLPCVVTDDASRREIVGLAGMFVKNPDNINEYSQAIETALKKKWGEVPRRQAEKFSWDEIAAKYEQQLTKLVKHEAA